MGTFKSQLKKSTDTKFDRQTGSTSVTVNVPQVLSFFQPSLHAIWPINL